uniref:ORF65b n=1 Tax=Pinus koraiensis TaxID=88728 RepID=Q85WW1_PINKO|nr:ORF65b [Pinus koraiensis]AAO74108.1 ORF65b [Pinus koraiensis]
MPPAFILSQDQTLHEIHSCITYSSLVDKADSASSLGITCLHLLYISSARSFQYSHPYPLVSIPQA